MKLIGRLTLGLAVCVALMLLPACAPDTTAPAAGSWPPPAESPGDPPLDELRQLQQELNTTDLALAKDDLADPALIGHEFAYLLIVVNHGPNPASRVRVTDELPPGVAYVGDSDGCVHDPPGLLTCDLGEVLARESRVITVTVFAEPSPATSGPITLTNWAAVENLAGADPEPANNRVAEETLLLPVSVSTAYNRAAHPDPCGPGRSQRR